MTKWIYLLTLLGAFISAKPKSSNIVVFLTDDLDSELNGIIPLKKTRAWLPMKFSNAFVSTPICCPSRASLLTGKYQHNTKVFNNSICGNCDSVQWRQGMERRSFAARLNNQYVSFYAGKYLNQYGVKHRGVKHVPLGWDFWAALVGNSKYYNYTLSINGKAEVHGDDYNEDYLTDVIGRKAEYFLNFYFEKKRNKPFLMVLATPAPHAPFTPAPKYRHKFSNHKAPRTPSFNKMPDDKNKHWFVNTRPKTLSSKMIKKVDEAFRNRWRTLLSVDDMVDGVMSRLKSENVLNNTVVIFTSDHGYHLGQFGMPLDKRQPYETDLRVPLLVRHPRQSKKRIVADPVVISIDLAPTILDIAGKRNFTGIDGKSFLSQMETPESTNVHMNRSFLVSYYGERSGHVPRGCEKVVDDQMSECSVEWDCKCQDSRNNTYNCIRTFTNENNFIHCKFLDDQRFEESYDLKADPFQLNNIADSLKPQIRNKMWKEWKRLQVCEGNDC